MHRAVAHKAAPLKSAARRRESPYAVALEAASAVLTKGAIYGLEHLYWGAGLKNPNAERCHNMFVRSRRRLT